MKRNLLYILGVVCLMTSCVEERIKEFEAAPGVEVDFNISMAGGPETKTLYGAESADGKSIKVNWVTGDLVEIFGTNCSVNQAEYKVTAQDTPTNVAKSLDKTVEVGVRWGDKGTSDFYALYPSDGASFTENTDGSVTLKTKISETQNNVFTLNETRTVELKETVNNETKTYNIPVWEGTHFANDAANPSMPSAIMYACTKGAAAKDAQGNLQPVSLHFKPFATVLKFRFMGYTSSLTEPTVYIQNIVVEAPKDYNIAGDFNLGISGTGTAATATASSANTEKKNVVTLNTILPGGTYLPLKKHQAVEFNVFTMPVAGQKMGKTVDSDLWKVTINTAQHGSFSYTLVPTLDGTVYELEPGKIHKVKVPQLPVNGTIEWNPENWITQIPTPVYISELSVPGAWYAYDRMPDGSAVKFKYQNGASLSELYKVGVRAFHLDCRASKVPGRFNLTSAYSYGDNVYLACAGTENAIGASTNTQLVYEGVYVLDALKDLVKLAVTHPKEYIVVVLTIAEKQYVNSSKNFGTIRPDVVIPLIKEVLENTDDISYTITNDDGTTTTKTTTVAETIYTEITKDTVIEDVLGRVIVKVNLNTDNFASYEIPTLTSFGSLAAEYSDVGVTEINKQGTLYESYFAKMNNAAMYIGKEDAELSFHYHQAQRTLSDGSTAVAGLPHYSDRKSAIDAIIDQSKEVYDAGTHDAWFQIGSGGSRKDASDNDESASRDEVATTLNTYLYNKIVDKMDIDPSPVGIVLMNNCTSTSGQTLIKAIIEMNGKFYLNRQGGSIITGGGTQGGNGGTNPTPAPAKNAAYAEVGEDAF